MRAMTPDDIYRIHWIGESDISPDGGRVGVGFIGRPTGDIWRLARCA